MVMKFFETHEFRKLVAAYRDGFLTFSELKEELEWCWEKINEGAVAGIAERSDSPVATILGKHA